MLLEIFSSPAYPTNTSVLAFYCGNGLHEKMIHQKSKQIPSYVFIFNERFDKLSKETASNFIMYCLDNTNNEKGGYLNDGSYFTAAFRTYLVKAKALYASPEKEWNEFFMAIDLRDVI